jgi:hypothetical protein
MDGGISRSIHKIHFHSFFEGNTLKQKERTIVRSLTFTLNTNERRKILDRLS